MIFYPSDPTSRFLTETDDRYPSGGKFDVAGSMREAVPDGLLASRELRVFDGLEFARTRYLPGDMEVPPLRGYVVNLLLGGSGRMMTRLDGRVWEGAQVPGNVEVFSGSQVQERSLDGPVSEAVNVLLGGEFVGRVAAEAGVEPDRVEVVDVLHTQDPALGRILQSFLPELETGGVGGELYARSLGDRPGRPPAARTLFSGAEGCWSHPGEARRPSLAATTPDRPRLHRRQPGFGAIADGGLAPGQPLRAPLLAAVQGGNRASATPVRDPPAGGEGEGPARQHRPPGGRDSPGRRLLPRGTPGTPLHPAGRNEPHALPSRSRPVKAISSETCAKTAGTWRPSGAPSRIIPAEIPRHGGERWQRMERVTSI